MSSHNSLPSDIKRKRLTKALERLGFSIDQTGGDGSHYKAIWKNEKFVVIPYNIHKQTLWYLLKEIQMISGLTCDDISKEY